MSTLLPTKRTLSKSVRDFAVIAVPAILLWVVGHPVDLQGFGLSAPATAKVVGYATTLLLAYRWYRDVRGTAPA